MMKVRVLLTVKVEHRKVKLIELIVVKDTK